MKKTYWILAMMLVWGMGLQAQNMDCLGLKNPTNFTLTGGNAQSIWAGAIGSKNAQASTCTTLGSTLNTAVLASSMSSTESSQYCTNNNGTDYNGQQDYTKRFVIKGSGSDPATGNHLSYLPPDNSFTSSIRLGNFCGNGEGEMMTYTFTVNSNNALVTIWYALSLQNGQHNAAQNPEFVIVVEKETSTGSGQWIPAMGDTLCYIRPTPEGSGTNVAPFYVGSTGTQSGATYGCNIYLPWNKVIINLSKLLYQRVRIKIAAGDCSMTAHYACCYVAGECQPMKLAANGCAAGETDQVAQIDAPRGANAYAWYRSKTGVLSGAARNDTNNYYRIPSQSDSSLNVTIDHFITQSGDTVTQSTFMCKMTTRMNETYDIVSPIFTDVGNTKPRLIVDSTLFCDASITLRDISVTPYTIDEDDLVDTMHTQWTFYSSPEPTPLTALETTVGPSAHLQYATARNYSARVRTTAYDTSCWNEKTVQFRTLQAPTPRIRTDRDSLCRGDAIALFDETLGSQFHEWTFHFPQGDSVILAPTPAVQMTFETTTRVTLRTRTGTYFLDDTNHDGVLDHVHCYATLDVTIHVQDYPTLHVSGDTIVCNGDQSNVLVSSDIDGCDYNWYSVLGGTTPVQEHSDRLTTALTQDRRYYVKVTSPFGCESWDSVNLYLVNPSLNADKDKICTGDTVTMWAGRAATYEWTTSAWDPTFDGQAGKDTIRVSPIETTTYTVVGHGTNGCSATALSHKVTVYPYPIQHIELTPDYIDSENPSVQFSDQSENGATSLWNFGNGNTSSIRTVVFTFTDLSQDSILIKLTTGNPLGCTVDTSFFVPVGIFAVWFPNAFTPKLETNNIFKPFTANELTDYELYIYDRTGTLVFQTTDVNEGWDGTMKEHECMPGAYVYIAKYRRNGVERVLSQKGTVMLIR